MTKRRRGRWAMIRWIWVRVGLLAGAVFITWSLWAFRATGVAHAALAGDVSVEVSHRENHWMFAPRNGNPGVGLIFYAGALVDPVAYAPLARAVAERGYPVVLVALPRRAAFGGAEGAAPLARGINATLSFPDVKRWVVAGHSRGGEVAARLARTNAGSLAGLVLIGTSHPRDFSLANSPLAVTQIYGSRDTVADPEKVQDARRNLPPGTREVRIEGGNHSQFGYYGFQPGDWTAQISREEQQRITVAAIVDTLTAAEAKVVSKLP